MEKYVTEESFEESIELFMIEIQKQKVKSALEAAKQYKNESKFLIELIYALSFAAIIGIYITDLNYNYLLGQLTTISFLFSLVILNKLKTKQMIKRANELKSKLD